jgi:Apea-like HEPN
MAGNRRFYPADKTVIRPENKKLIRDLGGRPVLIAGVGLGRLIESLEVAVRHTNPEKVLANRNLRLACEIYGSSFFESSRPARFLSLMTVLESLIDRSRRPERFVECVDDFVRQFHSRRDDLIRSCGEQEFNSLAGSLRNLRERSIAQSIRSLLRDTLGDDSAAELAAFEGIYETRSRLVHRGISNETEIGRAISTLDALVPKVLEQLLTKAAISSGP